MLDEFTNGLDPVGIAEIRQLILDLNAKGHTIIMASHLLDEVEKICIHVAIMKNGNLLSCGPAGEVLANEDHVELGVENLDVLEVTMRSYPSLINCKKGKESNPYKFSGLFMFAIAKMSIQFPFKHLFDAAFLNLLQKIIEFFACFELLKKIIGK